MYFDCWNKHDIDSLSSLLENTIILRDWNIFVEGKYEVLKATKNIFTGFPDIYIDILNIHSSESTNTVICEIIIKFNNDKNEKIKVVDIIELSENNKISAIRAYKG